MDIRPFHPRQFVGAERRQVRCRSGLTRGSVNVLLSQSERIGGRASSRKVTGRLCLQREGQILWALATWGEVVRLVCLRAYLIGRSYYEHPVLAQSHLHYCSSKSCSINIVIHWFLLLFDDDT